MSETWQETVNVEYTYDCPTDNYLSGKINETITENYNGPARLVSLVDKETNVPEVVLREWEAYDGRPDRLNCYSVVIDCSENALVCEVLSDYHNNHLDDENLGIEGNEDTREMKSISTPDGYNEFTYPYPIHPDELYDDKRSTYNKETETWNLQKNTTFDILGESNWDEIRSLRNEILQNTDGMMSSDVPENIKTNVGALRQKLRDLPEELAGIDEVFVPSSFPSTSILEK